MELISIENTTDIAYRFTPVLKFIPGEITRITKKDLESKPMIKKLIEGGQLKIVGAQNEPEKDEVEEV